MSAVRFLLLALGLMAFGMLLAWLVYRHEQAKLDHEHQMEILERELDHEEFQRLFEEDEERR